MDRVIAFRRLFAITRLHAPKGCRPCPPTSTYVRHTMSAHTGWGVFGGFLPNLTETWPRSSWICAPRQARPRSLGQVGADSGLSAPT